MFLSPVLENSLEIGTYFISLFKHILCLFIQIKLNTVTHDHQIQYQTLVLWLVAGVTNNILNKLIIVSNQFFLDVPVGLFDHVGQEDDLNLVQ